jgi:predicted alpha-1,6-mannanase (GH76 family)
MINADWTRKKPLKHFMESCRVRRQTVPRLILVLLAALGQLPSTVSAQSIATYHARADQGLQSFLLKFWNGGQQYLGNNFPNNGSLTGYWTYANGWDALLDGVERTGGAHYAGLIESLYVGQNERGWTNNYYDDECWMTLALIRSYDLTTNAAYLNQAKALYADIMGGWDNTCCGATLGGMWWDKAHTQKATAANAGAALAGARLYQRTTNATYLSFAQQVYSFWWTNMVNLSTYQVCDHFDSAGNKIWWKFTYNEGLMIGASVELNEATGDATYLTNAHRIANFMINNEVISTAYGNALHDGDNSGCGGDCHQFKGPAYRYLMRLYQKDTTKTAYYNVLKASADAVWNLARDTTNTVFSISWAGPAQSAVDQGQDNAACMALNLFAKQFGAYPVANVLSNQWEAEDATLQHILLEANGSGFTGWGYVGGWLNENQWLDFKMNFPTPGGRTLTFRYAAGAGNATRSIRINGTTVVTNLGFPNTGSWSSYNTASVACNFPAGSSTLSLRINPALGNGNYVNIDNLIATDLRITGFILFDGTLQLAWNAVAGQTYRVQFAPAPDGVWNNLGATVVATNTTATATDVMGDNAVRYYRVRTP